MARRQASGSATRSCPAMRAVPEVGARKPARIFMVVDLPAPLGPRKPTTSPGSRAKLTPASAWNGP